MKIFRHSERSEETGYKNYRTRAKCEGRRDPFRLRRTQDDYKELKEID